MLTDLFSNAFLIYLPRLHRSLTLFALRSCTNLCSIFFSSKTEEAPVPYCMFITEILNRNKSLYFHYISLILLWKGIIHHLSKIESSSLIPSILWRKRYFDMFCYLDIASPWKSKRLFIIYPKMLHANFEWDWPSHFGGDFQILFHNHSTWKKKEHFLNQISCFELHLVGI